MFEGKLDRLHWYVIQEQKEVEEGSKEKEILDMVSHIMTGGELPEEDRN